MPVYEAAGYRRQGLTKQQQKEQLAAIYGVPQNVMTPQLSLEDIERMRALLAAHDQQNRKGIKEFDLNNPPKEPYVYREYPKMLFDHDTRKPKVVHTAAQEKQAIEDGWKAEPYLPEAEDVREIALSPAERAEVERLDKQARKPKEKK